MLTAESLLDTKPDRAQKLLLSIPHPCQLSEADNAAWCLLYTHSQYRLYQNIKSDSLIRIAVNYYENSHLSKQSGTAYYLWGCILRMNNNLKGAMRAFKKAESTLESKRDNIKGLVEFEIGYLYKQDEAYKQSLHDFKQSLICFTLSKNIKYQAYAYREISNIYSQLNYPFDSVMHYSNEALKRANKAGDSINYYSIVAHQGELFIYTNCTRSKEYILKAYRHSTEYRSSHYTALLSYDYSMLNRQDSAQYYLKLSLADTLDTKYSVTKYLAMAYVAQNKGEHNNAFEYFKTAYILRDSTLQQSLESQIHRIDKQYDLSEKEKENTNLKIANRNKIIIISLLIIIVLVLFIVALIIRSHHKRKQSEHEIENQRILYKYQTQKFENDQKRELLLSKLQNRIENTLRLNQLKVGLLQQEKHAAFMEEMMKQAIISENEWQYYIDEVNQLYDGKIVKLSENHKTLTTADLIVITLICLHKDITDCCSLLDMSINTMYVRRKRIKKRLELDADIDLDKWIIDNVAQYDEEKALEEEV